MRSLSVTMNRLTLSRNTTTGRHGLDRQGSQPEAERGEQPHDGGEFGISSLAKRPVEALAATLGTLGDPGHAFGSGYNSDSIAYKVGITGLERCRQILGARLWRVEISGRVKSRRPKHDTAPKSFAPARYLCPVVVC